jgi:hypothetical protein
VRGVYLSLARILHPDTVTDPHERAHREEFMKQATSAYREGNLYALLKLEVEWATHASDRLSVLSDETLDVYIDALKGEVAELEDALRRRRFDPRYAEIQALVALPERAAGACMHERVLALSAQIDDLVSELAVVSRATRTSVVMGRVHDYLARSQAAQEIENLVATLYARSPKRR